MSLGRDLLVTARQLAKARPSKPRQADLRRAVSTSYYAAFHALAQDCADRLVGTTRQRSEPAWRQAYRALDHVNLAQQAVRDLHSATYSDRKALAVLMLLRRR